MIINLSGVENQRRWRVAVVAVFAKLMGVLIHVEGVPMGSNRACKHQTPKGVGASGGGPV